MLPECTLLAFINSKMMFYKKSYVHFFDNETAFAVILYDGSNYKKNWILDK